MEKTTKKSRKAIHNYTFENQNGEQVKVDLNSYVATCTVTGNAKKFYHAYLAKLIANKYDNNIDVFEQNYVSREGRAGESKARELDKVRDRISKLYDQIRTLKSKRDELINAG